MSEKPARLAPKTKLNMTHQSLRSTYLKRWQYYARSILRRRISIPNLDEVKKSEDTFITKRLPTISNCKQGHLKANDADFQGRVELAKVEKTHSAESKVVISRRMIPEVSYLHIFQFIVWSIWLVLVQAWADFWEGRSFRAILATDAWAHYYYIPMSKLPPRVVISGPYNRIKVRLMDKVTRRYEEGDFDLSSVQPAELINCASNNYGGFTDLEYGAEKVIAAALLKLPLAPAPHALELQVRRECEAYMGFDACVTAPSGFSTNVLAFATVQKVVMSLERKLVFLCDRDCHNSMFTGAYFNQEAGTHKFNHNDLTDLEFKLRMYREQDPEVFICVAVEGIYSLEGAISPGPALIALKRVYKFALLVDEAHSFMALGSAGRGSFNHWQDAGYDCPLIEVDIMSCMFSKSVGGTGGFVLANGIFAEPLRKGGEELEARGVETLSTIVLLRILGLLRKPKLITHRMQMLKEKAAYVSKELSRAGLCVLASPGSAVICLPVGTVHKTARFHTECAKLGVAVTGAGPPATEIWGCRNRLSVFATMTWPDIYKLLTTCVLVCHKIGLPGVKSNTRFDPSLLTRTDPIDASIEMESKDVDNDLLRYVEELSLSASGFNSQNKKLKDEVINAGMEGLKKYGIGPCSARWFYGSFDVFIQLERRLAGLYPSLLKQSMYCRAMICGDAEITIGSTLTALIQKPAANNAINYVFVPSSAPHSVLSGAKLRKSSRDYEVIFYETPNDLLRGMKAIKDKKFHLTLFFQTINNGETLNLISLLDSISIQAHTQTTNSNSLSGLTIMLDDRNGLGKIGPRTLGYFDLMESQHGVNWLKDALGKLGCRSSVVIAGSWFDAFGHQGGYAVGTADVIEALTWEAKAYFFSTPPMPLQAAMSDKMLELLAGSG